MTSDTSDSSGGFDSPALAVCRITDAALMPKQVMALTSGRLVRRGSRERQRKILNVAGVNHNMWG